MDTDDHRPGSENPEAMREIDEQARRWHAEFDEIEKRNREWVPTPKQAALLRRWYPTPEQRAADDRAAAGFWGTIVLILLLALFHRY